MSATQNAPVATPTIQVRNDRPTIQNGPTIAPMREWEREVYEQDPTGGQPSRY